MQRRLKAHTLAGRRLVGVSPRIQQRIGLRQEKAFVGYLRPFSVEQTGPHITDMTEADISHLRKLSAPAATQRGPDRAGSNASTLTR